MALCGALTIWHTFEPWLKDWLSKILCLNIEILSLPDSVRFKCSMPAFVFHRLVWLRNAVLKFWICARNLKLIAVHFSRFKGAHRCRCPVSGGFYICMSSTGYFYPHFPFQITLRIELLADIVINLRLSSICLHTYLFPPPWRNFLILWLLESRVNVLKRYCIDL